MACVRGVTRVDCAVNLNATYIWGVGVGGVVQLQGYDNGMVLKQFFNQQKGNTPVCGLDL